MRKPALLCIMLLIVSCAAFAQDVAAFGAVELRNGSFYYRDSAFEKLVIGATGVGTLIPILAKDCVSLTCPDLGDFKVLTFKLKDGSTLELPMRSIRYIMFKDKGIYLVL